MSDEIKEILDKLEKVKDSVGTFIEIDNKGARILLDYITNLQREIRANNDLIPYFKNKVKELKKIITNLQQENENLKEDNWAYHQLLRAGNKREYRSKFLKDFQKEYGENVFPDYDEIYKRYDKLKRENERLIKELENVSLDEANIRADILLEQEDYKEKDKEIARLNNIIEELEKWLNKISKLTANIDEKMTCKNVLDKLNELKENSNKN